MRVLVCVQSGIPGELLLRSYAKLFHKQGDEVIVLHVAHKAKLPTFAHGGGIGYVGMKAEAAMKDWRRKVESVRKNSEKVCTELGLEHKILVKETEGGVGECIVESALKCNVDMIAVGTKGLGFLGRLFLGSVDDYIKTHTSIPTLVCPEMAF